MNFTSGKDLLKLCQQYNKKIYEICIEREIELTKKTKQEIIQRMSYSLDIMKNSINKSLTEDIKSVGGLIGGEAKLVRNRLKTNKSVCGPLMTKAISAAMGVLEVNASMGLVVAAPTAGSCGILPAGIITVGEEFKISDEEMLNAIFTAAAIGIIITKNATVAGAEGGCQAETGSAAAMTAAGIVEMMGGTCEQALHAASMALSNVMGLVCDPIAGLVEAPCQTRNSIGVANALISAEMALAGVKSVIPFDEVVEAMYKVGKSLPYELRETALGGVAATCTGCEITKKIFG
ncbi:L-serine dehydratase [Alkalithermobacter thermoalcaliphilus JW-YL-7 = DSM 7308]|uniref:L-serine dehydratase n=1 Tax=Alkalithermobacter thermoalcaliphilus JW-YL-7 = DSM 7308 TaxID=1121328 RepID=A0A150FRB7_CLOPD|nr:L-serine dehydratase, iron-sulfur-dependent, alpha subunit [[Clostridium] paradoxum JW-YL-7 = DSM 7308]SHL02436.1 L-serine dehydratase [[Clostridium] paradoxum JW-YL-7 = DSM 7308]